MKFGAQNKNTYWNCSFTGINFQMLSEHVNFANYSKIHVYLI